MCDGLQRQAQAHALGTSTVGCQVACLQSDMQSLQSCITAHCRAAVSPLLPFQSLLYCTCSLPYQEKEISIAGARSRPSKGRKWPNHLQELPNGGLDALRQAFEVRVEHAEHGLLALVGGRFQMRPEAAHLRAYESLRVVDVFTCDEVKYAAGMSEHRFPSSQVNGSNCHALKAEATSSVLTSASMVEWMY